MRTYFDDKATYESVKPKETVGATVRIFDFDGTLFNSPNPNPALWDRKVFGRLKGDIARGGYGWYQNPLTLQDKYIDPDDFVEPTVEEVKKSAKDPNSVTVLLTGRSIAHQNQIRKVLDNKGLVFDEYGLKHGGKTTMQFKQDFIRDLIKKYQPQRIELWEDRFKHIGKFEEFLDALNIKNKVHYVRNPDAHIKDTELEKELVGLLLKDPRVMKKPEQKKKEGPRKTYFVALLMEYSRHDLLNRLKPYLEKDWKIIVHHMTIAFIKPKKEEVKEYLENNIGKKVSLTAVEIGKSPEAMAVKIESDVPVDNEIPHITVATPTGKGAVKSNYITDWKPLDEPIALTAIIREIPL